VIVQCPSCARRYKLDEARLSNAGARLKCSRCNYVFTTSSSSPKKRSPIAPHKPPSPRQDENLSLPFDEPVWNAAPLPPEPEPDIAAELDAAPGAATTDDEFQITETDDTYTLGTADEEEAPPPPPVRSEAKRPRPPRPRPVARPLPSAADLDRGKFRAILTFVAIAVLVYGGLAGTLLASPELTDRFVHGIPFVGSTLGGDRLMSRKIALSDLSGSYQRIKDGKQVFVITGKAFNSATVALQSVQIAGKLFSNDGRLLEQKTIYCGNVISAKVLKDLTPQMLSILQQLNPPKQFTIEPGASSTFVIVFMEPPEGTVEFSAQVVAAQRQA
jgi:predicted Zn finger-like uncharacterized protein